MANYIFYNLSNQHMDFAIVVERIQDFMKQDPTKEYRLSIGTDSKVHRDGTRFITAIHVHRLGNGAWGCLRNQVIHKKMTTLKEKIQLETLYSQEVAYLFTSEKVSHLMDIVRPYDGACFSMEIHLDIGKYGLTREFIQETTERITSMGLVPKIKPDSYTAFSYANRFTR